jgi:putative Mg2+ transporter-C (MgtC) family protein
VLGAAGGVGSLEYGLQLARVAWCEDDLGRHVGTAIGADSGILVVRQASAFPNAAVEWISMGHDVRMSAEFLWGEPTGQGWEQAGELAVALVLSSVIGLEREIRQKAAGLRTYTIVGLGAALFVLVSKYGFTDVLRPDLVVLDPSRMAAQIVSGLGFIGGGVIFLRRDAVRGLTTAASLWLTAGVGAAAGAGLGFLALIATVGYFLVCYGLRPLVHRLPVLRAVPVIYRIEYQDGRGLLRVLLNLCTNAGFSVARFAGTDQGPVVDEARGDVDAAGHRVVQVVLSLEGRGDAAGLTAQLATTPGVLTVARVDADDEYS